MNKIWNVIMWKTWGGSHIFQARTFLLSLKNTFYLMLCYHLSLTLIQVLASLMLLPPVLAPQHLMWLLIFVIPLLSLSMMANAVDYRIMNNATVKYPKNITKEVQWNLVITEIYIMNFHIQWSSSSVRDYIKFITRLFFVKVSYNMLLHKDLHISLLYF